MSKISKIEYIDCLSKMINMTNGILKGYAVGDFISYGTTQDERIGFYKIKAIKLGVCTVQYSFFSISIETLVPPSMVVEPIAEVYSYDWRSMRGKPSKEIVRFSEGGESQFGMIMPWIEPFYRWCPEMRWEPGNGGIEEVYPTIQKMNNVAMVEVLNKVKDSERQRAEEEERKRREQRARMEKEMSITKDMINDLLNSI